MVIMKKYIVSIVFMVLAVLTFIFIVYLGKTDEEGNLIPAVLCILLEAVLVVLFFHFLFKAMEDRRKSAEEAQNISDCEAVFVRKRAREKVTLSDDIIENLRYVIFKAADEGRTSVKFNVVKGSDIQAVKAYLVLRGFSVKTDPKSGRYLIVIWA